MPVDRALCCSTTPCVAAEEMADASWYCRNRFSRDRPRFMDTLDVIKFLCKDMWTLLFRKQIDNLKTNHRVCFPSTSRHTLPIEELQLMEERI